jgi:hypothetical protein
MKKRTSTKNTTLTKEEQKIITYLHSKGIRYEWQLRMMFAGMKLITDAINPGR